MARFKQVAKGSSARQRVAVTLADGSEWAVDVTPLIGEQEADVLAGARAYAKAHGIEDPRPDQELYELGLWAHTILIACFDPDEPAKRTPAFDSVAQILDRETGLDRDRIAYLFEAQQRHQDACGFRKRGLDAAEYINAVVTHATAEEDGAELPFERWPPATRRSFVRTMASQLLSLTELRSLSGPGLPVTARTQSSSSDSSAKAAQETPGTAG